MIKVQASKDMLEEMQQQTNLIRQEIKAAQDCQKSYADARRTLRVFKENDMVFLRICHKKSSLSLGKYKKLNTRYAGPFKIIKKVNDQAYKLELPSHIKVYNVFHVNLLKKYILDPNHIFIEDQLIVSKDNTFQIKPEAILQTRTRIIKN